VYVFVGFDNNPRNASTFFSGFPDNRVQVKGKTLNYNQSLSLAWEVHVHSFLDHQTTPHPHHRAVGGRGGGHLQEQKSELHMASGVTAAVETF